FQAVAGRRVFHVTGVQTCALPIWPAGRRPPARRRSPRSRREWGRAASRDKFPPQRFSVDLAVGIERHGFDPADVPRLHEIGQLRSEERRGGKEWHGGREAGYAYLR